MKTNRFNLMISLTFTVFLITSLSLNASTISKEKVKKDTTIYEQVDQIATFKENLHEWVDRQLTFTPQMGEINGEMIVSFVIERGGTVSNIQLLQSVHPAIDLDVMQLLEDMPRWDAARIGKKKVRSRLTFTFPFHLSIKSDSSFSYSAYLKYLDAKEQETVVPQPLDKNSEYIKRLVASKRPSAKITEYMIYKRKVESLEKFNVQKELKTFFKQTGLSSIENGQDIIQILREKNMAQLALVKSLGADDFSRKYECAAPLLKRIDIEEQIKLRRCLSDEQFRIYFKNYIQPTVSIINQDKHPEPCDFFCLETCQVPYMKIDILSWLQSNLKYPLQAQERNIQGTVKVTFNVQEDGILRNFSLVSRANAILEKEALRIVKNYLLGNQDSARDTTIPSFSGKQCLSHLIFEVASTFPYHSTGKISPC